ncbi:hypothetical protein H0O01_04315 [Candidatus Micrarchaeota archaeon]|nr:hypothetical protein [Candidatus Micrarchaeota archaeon]
MVEAEAARYKRTVEGVDGRNYEITAAGTDISRMSNDQLFRFVSDNAGSRRCNVELVREDGSRYTYKSTEFLRNELFQRHIGGLRGQEREFGTETIAAERPREEVLGARIVRTDVREGNPTLAFGCDLDGVHYTVEWNGNTVPASRREFMAHIGDTVKVTNERGGSVDIAAFVRKARESNRFEITEA